MFADRITCDEFVNISSMLEHDFLEFSELQDSLNIKSKELFKHYIKEVYKDLSEKDINGRKVGISKITFFEYIKIPIFICESIFKSFDTDKDGYLSLNELGNGLTLLYLGNFEEVVHLIFKIYDSNQDGFIHREDVRLILSYLPLKEDQSLTTYKHQLDSQDEIRAIVKSTFSDTEELNFEKYLKVVENQKSDSFVQLLCYLYEKKVFNEENLSFLEKNKDILNKVAIQKVVSTTSSNSLKLIEYHSPQPKRRIPSPTKVSYLSPVNQFLRRKSERANENDSLIKLFTMEGDQGDLFNFDLCISQPKIPETSAYEGMIRLHNLKVSNRGEEINTVIEYSTSGFDSPSNFLRRLTSKKKETLGQNSPFKLSSNIFDNEARLKRQCSSVQGFLKEGWIYKITESSKLKKYWLEVKNEEIFYYKDEMKEELSGMHNLSGCSIKEGQPTLIHDQLLYSFTINFQNRIRTYYCVNREQSTEWVSCLRKAVGYECFFDHYEIIDDIGRGKFGVVKLGVHKSTKTRVAIKTIKKDNIKTKQDQELVKVEIDIMKLCRHPNIVNLLDHFENSDYIFIVMEYIQGGDLAHYVRKFNGTLTEKKASELMKNLALGLQYLHGYGIIHRDLKPDNLMMTDRTAKADIKIMDFGLSKMMHYGENVADGFGTLSFVAPEVLLRKSYNSKVDVWSLGIIIYNLLSGELPFDHPKDDEKIIAKKVVFSQVEFRSSIWMSISTEAKSVISSCLIKDQEKRITISEFLETDWIKSKISNNSVSI